MELKVLRKKSIMKADILNFSNSMSEFRKEP